MHKTLSAVTAADVSRAAAAAGVKKGGILLLHSGMKAVGPLEKGPDTIIDGLLDLLGPQGTLVMPAFTWADVPETPPTIPFIQENAPSVWTGRVPARFCEYPGVKRSRHPMWSHAIRGPLAEELIALDDKEIFGYGKQKIHYRIGELGGGTMFISASFKSCSSAYVLFDLREMPHRQFIKEHQGLSVDQYLRLSPQEQWKRMYFPPSAVAKSPRLAKLEEPLRQAGLLHEAPLGADTIKHVFVREMYQFMNEQYDRNPRFLFDD